MLIVTIFGCINYLFRPSNSFELFLGFLLLPLSFLLTIALIGKKGLYVLDNRLFLGISVVDNFIIKKEVEIENFSEFINKKKVKTDLPRLLEFSALGLFSNHDECFIYLFDSRTGKTKKLISITDLRDYAEVSEFLQRWTDLKEGNGIKK